MKYRDAILKKLDNVDSSLNRLNLTLNQVIGLVLLTAGVATLIVYGVLKVAIKK